MPPFGPSRLRLPRGARADAALAGGVFVLVALGAEGQRLRDGGDSVLLLVASWLLITALFAVGAALGLIALASHVFTIADFTPPITMLVGLGVGVDYALLIFYRYRHELTDGFHRYRHDPADELTGGADPAETARRALDAAGRTVFFAGCTVIIALLGLVALGLGSLQGVALALALTVLTTMAASLVLLPALLALFGRRIQRHVLERAAKAATKDRAEGRRWRALAAAVQRRPLPALLVAVLALLALSARRWACASASPTRATTRTPRPPGRRTTCWRRVSARASTVRSSS